MLNFIVDIDKILRPQITKLPSYIPIFFYSYGRKLFLKTFYNNIPKVRIELGSAYQKDLLGLKFQSNLFNAAGMFKEVFGYEVSYRQGAGAFLVGTITPLPRKGNFRFGIKHPFVPLVQSNAAINWMGLPNIGIDEALKRISQIEKKEGCPLGISISQQPELPENQAIRQLIDSLLMTSKSQVDFIELNESCPNVSHSSSLTFIGNLDKSLIDRLEIIADKFLKKRTRNLPVIVKFSNDTDLAQVRELVDTLVSMGYDGVNFGNTSTNYHELRTKIHKNDLHNFDYFTSVFGGGVSGNVLKDKSLELCKMALQSIPKALTKEFVVIRTGGVENHKDLIKSNDVGIYLNQWFTGYFEMFSKHKHNLYKIVLGDENKD